MTRGKTNRQTCTPDAKPNAFHQRPTVCLARRRNYARLFSGRVETPMQEKAKQHAPYVEFGKPAERPTVFYIEKPGQNNTLTQTREGESCTLLNTEIRLSSMDLITSTSRL